MKSRPEPTTTLFAILGMIAIRPMTPYALAKQFDRSLGRAWPRARSKLFEGPKFLVELGYARAAKEKTGRRAKTVYSITPAGRRALAAWLATPGEGPALEFEQFLKVFFAEQGSKDGLVANLVAAREWAQQQIAEHIVVGTAYAGGSGPYQQRLAILSITGTFLAEFAMTVDRWAEWALDVVADWPSDPGRAVPDPALLKRLVRRLQHRLLDDAAREADRARG